MTAQRAHPAGCPARFDDQLGVWVVDDPADVRAVLLDPGTFPPDNALTAHTQLTRPSLRALAAADFALPPTLASNSSPSHLPIRRTVARFLSPARVAACEDPIRAFVVAAAERAAAVLEREHRVDLMAEIAGPVPALTLFRLFGLGDVPPELKSWSQDSFELFWGWPDPDRQLVIARSAGDYYRWLRTTVEAARRSPGEDLFSALIALGLDDDHVCAAGYFLLIAGQETTSMLVATIMLRLLQGGDWARATDADYAAEAVEQTLREESSVPTWRRSTRAPAVIGSVEVPRRAQILLGLSGTGADADLAFGVGIHRCLGAGIARLESRLILQGAAVALPELELAESDPPWTELLSFRAPRRVLVERPAR